MCVCVCLKKGIKAVAMGGVLAGAFSIFLYFEQKKNWTLVKRSCQFPAIYNFGDSNSDTGSRSAAFLQVVSH